MATQIDNKGVQRITVNGTADAANQVKDNNNTIMGCRPLLLSGQSGSTPFTNISINVYRRSSSEPTATSSTSTPLYTISANSNMPTYTSLTASASDYGKNLFYGDVIYYQPTGSGSYSSGGQPNTDFTVGRTTPNPIIYTTDWTCHGNNYARNTYSSCSMRGYNGSSYTTNTTASSGSFTVNDGDSATFYARIDNSYNMNDFSCSSDLISGTNVTIKNKNGGTTTLTTGKAQLSGTMSSSGTKQVCQYVVASIGKSSFTKRVGFTKNQQTQTGTCPISVGNIRVIDLGDGQVSASASGTGRNTVITLTNETYGSLPASANVTVSFSYTNTSSTYITILYDSEV